MSKVKFVMVSLTTEEADMLRAELGYSVESAANSISQGYNHPEDIIATSEHIGLIGSILKKLLPPKKKV